MREINNTLDGINIRLNTIKELNELEDIGRENMQMKQREKNNNELKNKNRALMSQGTISIPFSTAMLTNYHKLSGVSNTYLVSYSSVC